MSKSLKKSNTRWPLVVYDVIVYIIASILLLWIYGGNGNLTNSGSLQLSILGFVCVFICRMIGNIYGQIWRYGGIEGYIRLIFSDAIAFILLIILQTTLPIERISFDRALSLVCVDLLGAISIRMIYRYAYLYSNNETSKGKFLSKLLYRFSGLTTGTDKEVQKIKIAIIGAGRVGASFAEELVNDEKAVYVPRCFIDIDKTKAGREVNGIPVWSADETTLDKLKAYEVQEIVFAIPNMDVNKKKCLYDHYKNAGYKVKVYDYPTLYTAGSKRNLREFDIEELLFRKPLAVTNEQTYAYYKDKVILITGGGGSIGSELCRQLAKMDPNQIIILDIYENGAYDVQQELKITYGNNINLQIEICSITHKKALEKVFKKYHPQIVINAAAHKHVPLMEHNCVEAIYNNVFGTKNLIELCEKYNAQRFMMVSTDKAVNPTNVMGATKRMCEMMVQSASMYGHVKYSATRFGNVLGSAGSVIGAKRLHIPIFHMEAGNRCKDECLPEETNRRIVDIISDVNMAYSEHARRYLADTGLPKERTYVTGSPMAEVLHNNLAKIEASDIHTRLGLEKGKYILLSAHREENIDTEKNFLSLFNAINQMAEKYDMPILYSCHPRSKKRIEATGFKLDPRVIQHEPLGFHDYNCLQMNAFCVVSDSGTLPEESSFFTSVGHSFPAVCIRTSTERPEALDKGDFILAGIDKDHLLQAVDVAVEMNKNNDLGIPVPDYVDENVSDKVVKIIQSYTGVVDKMVWRKY